MQLLLHMMLQFAIISSIALAFAYVELKPLQEIAGRSEIGLMLAQEPIAQISKSNTMNQRGVTTLELLLVVVIIGILSMISMTEFIKLNNRAYVGAALSDLQVLRKAISMHDAEWGYFPDIDSNNMPGLVSQLLDPLGQPYLTPPSGDNWRSFTYSAPDPSDLTADYDLTVICNDHYSTQITVHWDSQVDYMRLTP